jgi:hypothetical protein
MCSEHIMQIKCQHVAGVAFSVGLKFYRLGTVGSRAVYVWFMVRSLLFRDMICLLDILKHRTMFQTRDTEQKVQAAYTATRNVVG